MDEKSLVLDAQNGNKNAFGQLIGRYQTRLLAFLQKKKINRFDCEEIVQNAFVQSFIKIGQLEQAEKFASWLFSICRNELLKLVSQRKREGDQLEMDESTLLLPFTEKNLSQIGPEIVEEKEVVLERAISQLPRTMHELVQLKYLSGFSMKEIEQVTGLEIKTIKSRLYEARMKLKQLVPKLADEMNYDPSSIDKQKENIMHSLEVIQLGAFIFARLSLADQVHLSQLVGKGSWFDEPLLKEIGKIHQGTDFLARYQKRLQFPELINILNYGDDSVEVRLLDELDRIDPDLSKQIKQNMFVFDDLVLLDAAAMRKLLSRLEATDMQTAFVTADPRVKAAVYKVLSAEEKNSWDNNLVHLDLREKTIKQKQYQIIELVKSMAQTGEFQTEREDSDTEYGVSIKSKS
jgi:RNA polymerase sigma-70 factor (ECF subfamily)